MKGAGTGVLGLGEGLWEKYSYIFMEYSGRIQFNFFNPTRPDPTRNIQIPNPTHDFLRSSQPGQVETRPKFQP